MKKEIFRSDRYFVLFEYTVSHGQLLLRSDKRKGYEENIDIIFFDTRYMQISTMLFGVTISLIDKDKFEGYKSLDKYLNYEGNNLFEIESAGEVYYLAGAFVKVFENKLDFNETSLGDQSLKEGRQIAGQF